MASTTAYDNIPESAQQEKVEPVHMKSVERVMNFWIVKSVSEVVKTVYMKIKENNPAAKRTLTSAESVVKNAVSTASPLVGVFQKPIEKVDNLLFSGLDYIEKNISTITKDPSQIRIQDLLNYMSQTHTMQALRSIPEFGKQMIINDTLISKAQQALLELAPYFTLKAYQQNQNIYVFITNKINELFLSQVTQELTNTDDGKAKEETTIGEPPKKAAQEPQTEEKPEPKTEGTTEKVAVTKTS